MNLEKKRFKFSLKKNSDILVAMVVLMVVFMMIIPLPATILDILIAFNLTVAVIILLMTLFTTEALEFSTFPTLLLITTLFRLGLNVSSVRLIIGSAYAGDIIKAFGEFVVQKNYVLGIMIYIIIVVVQFVVITNGSGRVAEVAARFTLDAMPGKQMAIDADLNTGLINDMEARERRIKLQNEADFYGSMDGASKFVKGDAISSLIITFINIIGGIIYASLIKGMDITTAAQTYTILTIGDGLVSQLPALLISTASGIIVTRSAGNSNFGSSLVKQLTSVPKVVAIAAGVLLILGFIPAMPKLPFFILAASAGYASYSLYKEEKVKVQTEDKIKEQEVMETENKEPENVISLINVEPMEIEIGYGLIPLADEVSGGDLLQRIASVRRQCAIEMGIVVQPIRIRDNLQLKTDEYLIKIRGTVVAGSQIMASMLLCMNPSGEDIGIPGIKTTEPTFELPAVWINMDKREEAEIKGFTVVDPTTVMVTHLTEVIKAHSYELLGRQEVKMMVDSMKEKYSAVVEELIPDLMTVGEIQKVLQNLLKEKVPIKDLVTIFECLADNSRVTKDIELLTEYVRMALNRTICNSYVDENNVLYVITVSPEIEQLVSSNIQKSIYGSFPGIDPESTSKILNSLKDMISSAYFYNNQPIILVSPKIRPAFRKFIEMVFGNVTVLSLNEVPNDIQIKTEGVVRIG